MISQGLAAAAARIAAWVTLGLLLVILLGHYIVTPGLTALLGVSAGCWIGAKHMLRHCREIDQRQPQRIETGRPW